VAGDVDQQVEDALNTIVKLTNKSGNLKKELRNLIHEKVSELRNLIYTIKDNLHEKISENAQLQNEVNEMKKSHKAQRNTQENGQLA
jgi:conjugal transfer/entry exclusion protein